MEQTFFSHFIAVVLHDYNVNFQKPPSYTFYEGPMSYVFPLTLFFRYRSFSPWWSLAFLIFSPLL